MGASFFIYSNNCSKSIALHDKLAKAFKKAKITLSDDAKNIIVLGGDGTFVHAFNKFASKKVKMILINTGRVGFYATKIEPNIKKIIEYFNNEDNFYSPDVIECEVNNKKFYSINEIVFQGINTVSGDCYINDIFYERFWGSGLCFCTRTGSTGYNKSLGSSILLTRSRIWQMSEISPLAHAKYLSIRNGLVLDEKQVITLTNLKAGGLVTLMNDGFEHAINVDSTFKLCLSKATAKIGFYKGLKLYINKLQEVFLIGGK